MIDNTITDRREGFLVPLESAYVEDPRTGSRQRIIAVQEWPADIPEGYKRGLVLPDGNIYAQPRGSHLVITQRTYPTDLFALDVPTGRWRPVLMLETDDDGIPVTVSALHDGVADTIVSDPQHPILLARSDSDAETLERIEAAAQHTPPDVDVDMAKGPATQDSKEGSK